MRGGPRSFMPDFTCPALLRCHLSLSSFRVRDFHPVSSYFPVRFRYEKFAFLMVHNPKSKLLVWAFPISLAATLGIEVSFSSSGYLDVSVPRVSFDEAIYSLHDNCTLLQLGFPIRTSTGRWIFAPHRSFSQLVTSFVGS